MVIYVQRCCLRVPWGIPGAPLGNPFLQQDLWGMAPVFVLPLSCISLSHLSLSLFLARAL